VKSAEPNPVSDASIKKAQEKIAKPFTQSGGENAYTLHHELQELTQSLVGIIRTKVELEEALVKIAELRERIAKVSVTGGREFNPGFHLSFDLDNMLLVAESTAIAGLTREESRGGHTRNDFPEMNPAWRLVNLICTYDGSKVSVQKNPLPAMPKELFDLFDIHELEKYLTPEEITKGGIN
jgi:succinate dehydrogenase / fumarate reductase flavoprotein subunit